MTSKADKVAHIEETIQPLLVSGTNIRTVNGTTLLGAGDVAVQATLASGINIRTVNGNTLLGSTDVAVQTTLVSGTNIKTINGLAILGSGNLTVGAVGVAWATKTANYTAAAGDAIMANTTGGAFTVTLPVSPVDNDTVALRDYAGTFGTNKLIVGRNGKNIMGLPQDMDITTSNLNIVLTYIAATTDWRF